MSLKYPAFIYGYNVDSSNNTIYFKEAADINERSFTIDSGSYTYRQLGQVIEDGLNNAGADNYTVTTNANTRTYTVASDNIFDLLANFDIDSLWPTVGFTVDEMAIASSTGSETGNIYYPQIPLQNYTPFEDTKVSISPNQTIAIQGTVRASTLGRVKRMKCSFEYITEKKFLYGSVIKTDENAFQNTRDFMDYITDKNVVEFIEDRTNFNIFKRCVLVRTRQSSQGLDYELENLDNNNFPGFKRISGLEFQEL